MTSPYRWPGRTIRACAFALLICGTASPIAAATLLYRTDAELMASASRIVRGRVIRVSGERGPGGRIYTITRLAVLEDFTGFKSPYLTLRELGGTIGSDTFVVGGAVTYQPGSEVLVMLEELPDGRFRSLAMGMSKFDVLPAADGDPLLLRNTAGSAIIGGNAAALTTPMRLSDFRLAAQEVRQVGSVAVTGNEQLVPDQTVLEPFTLLTFNNGLGVRWTEADTGTPVRWYRNNLAPAPVAPADGVAEIQTALSAWTAPTSASIELVYAGAASETNTDGPWASLGTGAALISFEDPNNEISGSVLAIGGGAGTLNAGGTVNGVTFNKFTSGFVIFQNAADLPSSFRQSLNFSRVLEHEIGHGIGLGHTQTDGSVINATSNIMYPSCCGTSIPVPPAIGPDDLAGLQFIYPSTGPQCTYGLSSSSADLPAAGGTATVTVTTTAGCSWGATSLPSWISAGPPPGSGSGSITLTVAANPAVAPRSAVVVIAGLPFTVTQAACACSVSPAAVGLGNPGGAVTIQLTAPGCQWTAFSTAGWASVTPGSGSGSATLTVNVLPNPGSTSRAGTLIVAGVNVPLTQAGITSVADFNADRRADLVWQHTDGRISAWFMNGVSMTSGTLLGPGSVADTDWRVVAAWDPNRDGWADLLWRHRGDGRLSTWTMAGAQLVGGDLLSPSQVNDLNWTIAGTGDFNLDGYPDILWHHATEGWISVWLMNGTTLASGQLLSPSRVVDTSWKPVGLGDFDRDGRPDIVWQHQTNGQVSVWFMNGTTMASGTLVSPAGVSDTNWKVRAVMDVNLDGAPDLIWQNISTGYLAAWLMNGTTMMDGVYLSPQQVADTGWRIVGPR